MEFVACAPACYQRPLELGDIVGHLITQGKAKLWLVDLVTDWGGLRGLCGSPGVRNYHSSVWLKIPKDPSLVGTYTYRAYAWTHGELVVSAPRTVYVVPLG